MNFNRLNRWLTLGANVGILVGLGALIVEINQSNAIALAEMEQTRSDGLREWRQEWALNDHVVPMMVRILSILDVNSSMYQEMDVQEQLAAFESALNELDPEDRLPMVFLVSSEHWDYENLYAQYQRGLN